MSGDFAMVLHVLRGRPRVRRPHWPPGSFLTLAETHGGDHRFFLQRPGESLFEWMPKHDDLLADDWEVFTEPCRDASVGEARAMSGDFTMALVSLRGRLKVRRPHWPPGRRLALHRAADGLPLIFLQSADGFEDRWAPTQTDILADDWEIVGDVAEPRD